MSMMGILQVASYIYKRYMDDFGVRIDEMKLHKLLYFTQRECLIQKGEPMFEAHFEAWKYAREGYDELDSCEVEMKTEDIMVDANRVRERRAVLRQLNLYSA